jgi:hypothetical protein
MSDSKTLKARIIHKHETEADWNKATNFIPLLGELIIYDRDTNYTYERFKIGDGITNVINLPFLSNFYVSPVAPVNALPGAIWIDTSEVSPIEAEGVSF